VSISVDDVAQTATVVGPPISLVFQAHGWEANTVNTFYVNGGDPIRPMTRYYDWANGAWPVPPAALHAGVNTIELRIGSTTTELDPATNANDDFNVRNVMLKFGDGTTVADPAVANNKTVPMGDSNATSNRSYTWQITVPASRLVSTSTFVLDGTVLPAGEHTVRATSKDGTRSADVTVRTGNPSATPERIVLTPPQDPSTAQSFTWRTGSSVHDGAVRIRESGSSGEWRSVEGYVNPAISSDGVDTCTHSATVSGLEPGTRYDYTVGDAQATSKVYSFTTAGDAGDPFTFLYFGDAQNELAEKWAPVVDAAYEKYPDAIGTVNAGDLIDASRNDSEWTEWFDAMDGRSQTTNVIAAPGNHEHVGDTFLMKWKSNFEYDHNGPADDGDPDAGATDAERQEAAYRTQIAKALEETAYYTDYQGVRFITLNAGRTEAAQLMTPADLPSCSVDCPNPAQLWLDMQAEWLDDILADNPNKWAVAVFHQPVFSTAEGRDEADIRATWLPVFERNDIDLVLMGHDHTYARGFLNKDATATPGVTTGPVYAVSVSGPKYYEQQPAGDNVWTQNGATQVASAGHTSTFQGITVSKDQIRYESTVAGKWDDQSTTDVPVGGQLDAFTITKYDSGAKFVTEDGVPVPEDPGTGPETPEDTGLAFGIANGSTVSGVTTLTATDALSADPVSIGIDGETVPVAPADSRVNIAFEAHGYLATTKNTIVINDTTTILPATAYNSYATGRFPIPAGALHPGVNKIEFYTGSPDLMNDPATDGRNDDFNVRNLRLEFADGTKASDPAMSPTAIANLGDNGANVRSWSWNITVPADELVSGSSYRWDTTTVESGPHVVTATSADGTRHSDYTLQVDNYEDVTLDLTDGDLVDGTRAITSTSDVEPLVTVDGERVDVAKNRRVIDPEFLFEGDGFQPDAAMDSIWINGSLFRVLGVPEAAHGYPTVRVEIPWEELRPGTNVIRIRAGGNLSPEATTGVDVFTTRNARMEFPGGRVVRDPAQTPAQVLNYNNNSIYHDFTITIPDRYETVYQAEWDSAALADGEHIVAVSRPDGRSSVSAVVEVDNSAPELAIAAPADGADYGKGSFTIDATALDAHVVASVDYTIDGAPAQNGQVVAADGLSDGEHLFVATAVDELGNTATRSVRFSTVGNVPAPPAAPQPGDGTVEVPEGSAQLSAVVKDPGGDSLDVQLLWGYRGDFADGSNTATRGSTGAATPDAVAGDAFDPAEYAAVAEPDGQVATTTGEGAYPFQQFEIAVPDTLGAAHYEVQWSGSVPATQRATLSVWNHVEGSWQLLAEGVGADLALVGDASVADTVRDGRARILVQDVQATVIAENDDDAVWAWISDTQFYSQNDPATYEKQMRWVLDNRDAEGIGYALHTGDIVNQRQLSQWQVADSMQRIWDDAGLPNGLVPGNHDIDADASYTSYKHFFGQQRYQDKPWYGGGYDDNVEHYDILSTPAADYLVVFVDWHLEQGDIDWANDVIRAHPDYNVIVATHQYFDAKGAYITPAPAIWDQIVDPNPNIDVVLSGHNNIWLNTKRADDGRDVIEVMADYQSAPNNGDGWMRTISFDAAAQTFSNRTFSPTHGRTWWVDDAMENFTLPVTLEAPERSVATDYVGVTAKGQEVIAMMDDIASGTRIEATTEALAADTRYSWFVRTTDAEGFSADSPVWSFRTAPHVEPALDTTAPVITIPETTRITVGEAFDPLADVTALDDRDGNLTAAVTISGSVDTATPGEYTLEYRVADAAGNVGTATRRVTVAAVDEPGDSSAELELRAMVIDAAPETLTLSMPTGATALIGSPHLVGGLSTSTGALPLFRVIDNRYTTAPGWSLSATVDPFVNKADAGVVIPESQLGLAPKFVTADDGVRLSDPQAPGHALFPVQIASAAPGGGVGLTELGADLTLVAPASAPAGSYSSKLTLTLVSQ
jgi:hypothetical protein